jgi:hypothetical protein
MNRKPPSRGSIVRRFQRICLQISSHTGNIYRGREAENGVVRPPRGRGVGGKRSGPMPFGGKGGSTYLTGWKLLHTKLHYA